MSEESSGGRLAFDAAVRFVQEQPDRAAFASAPVFGDDGQTAEGARVFIIQSNGAGGWQLLYIAAPFFVNAFGAFETLAPGEVPERVRELLFLPTRVEAEWLEAQIQILIQKLMEASGQPAPHMPDYESAPAPADGDAVPVSFIRREKT